MEIKERISQWNHIQTFQITNVSLSNKYMEVFYFYEAKPINEIIFDQKNSISSIRFNDMLTYKETAEFLKRYYFMINKENKQEIKERMRLLTDFYSKVDGISFQYPTMIIANMKNIMSNRIRRKLKMTAADDTENQIVRRKNAKNENYCEFDFFKDYENISVSKKQQYINGYQNNKAIQQDSFQYSLNVHNVYQSQTMPNTVGVFKFDQMKTQLEHTKLVYDFNQYDEDRIIRQYQIIQVKRRKRAEELTNKIHLPIKEIQISKNLIQSAHYQQKSLRKNNSHNFDEFIKKNQTGVTRETKEYSNERYYVSPSNFTKLLNSDQKVKSNPLFKSNTQNDINKGINFGEKKYQSRDNNYNYDQQIKRYCLNLHTKEVFQKEYHVGHPYHYRTNTENKIDKYKSQNKNKTQKQQLQHIQQNVYKESIYSKDRQKFIVEHRIIQKSKSKNKDQKEFKNNDQQASPPFRFIDEEKQNFNNPFLFPNQYKVIEQQIKGLNSYSSEKRFNYQGFMKEVTAKRK